MRISCLLLVLSFALSNCSSTFASGNTPTSSNTIDSSTIDFNYLNKQKVLWQEEADNKNMLHNLLSLFFALCIAVFLLLYNRYQLRQHNSYQLKINQHQNELFTAAIAAQDKERKRIAEDLHDGLGSLLSAAKLKLSRIEDEKIEFTREQLENYNAAQLLLNDAIIELRNISHNIMPASLSKLGLVAALKSLLDNISSHSGLSINFSTHDFDDRLEEANEISIYRIILELLNNIVKHAEAKHVVVQLIKYPEYLNITVEDDGKGFNFEKIMIQNRGIGLSNITSRVESMNGKFFVDSSEGHRTTVIIDIPLNPDKPNG